MSVTGTRVFGHPQVVEYQAYVTRESSHFLRHAPSAFGFEHADGETTKPSEIFRTVVIIVPIDHVVATLDGPVAAVDPQNALRSGLFRRAAGEAVTDFERTLTALFVRAVPLDDERLAHMRKNRDSRSVLWWSRSFAFRSVRGPQESSRQNAVGADPENRTPSLPEDWVGFL